MARACLRSDGTISFMHGAPIDDDTGSANDVAGANIDYGVLEVALVYALECAGYSFLLDTAYVTLRNGNSFYLSGWNGSRVNMSCSYGKSRDQTPRPASQPRPSHPSPHSYIATLARLADRKPDKEPTLGPRASPPALTMLDLIPSLGFFFDDEDDRKDEDFVSYEPEEGDMDEQWSDAAELDPDELASLFVGSSAPSLLSWQSDH